MKCLDVEKSEDPASSPGPMLTSCVKPRQVTVHLCASFAYEKQSGCEECVHA